MKIPMFVIDVQARFDNWTIEEKNQIQEKLMPLLDILVWDEQLDEQNENSNWEYNSDTEELPDIPTKNEQNYQDAWNRLKYTLINNKDFIVAWAVILAISAFVWYIIPNFL
jgi:hypothetical protein